jgi:hypothetical protein
MVSRVEPMESEIRAVGVIKKVVERCDYRRAQDIAK